MLDQSHNVTDPIESLMVSAMETQRAYAQALVVDREALAGAQDANDVMLGHRILKAGFVTDVSPILAAARLRNGGAIDPIAVYRASNYRKSRRRSALRSRVRRQGSFEEQTIARRGHNSLATPDGAAAILRAKTAPQGRRGFREASARLLRRRRRHASEGMVAGSTSRRKRRQPYECRGTI